MEEITQFRPTGCPCDGMCFCYVLDPDRAYRDIAALTAERDALRAEVCLHRRDALARLDQLREVEASQRRLKQRFRGLQAERDALRVVYEAAMADAHAVGYSVWMASLCDATDHARAVLDAKDGPR